jgi:acetylornithine aminotransferase/acetylornithine/N-succinyldiaminopimelate aminotransferase
VKDAYDEQVAAVLVEPVQGEGGINIASEEFIEGLRKFCNEKSLLLIFDEIQCGLGRTGKMFAYENYNVEPDIMTLAKPLAGGLPLGALIAREEVASAYKPGDHGTTFGGNPVACAAALAFLQVIQEDDLLAKCLERGKYFQDSLDKLKTKYSDFVKDIRVIGLMVGLEVENNGPEIVSKMIDERILINCTAEKVLRFLPPLIVQEKEIDYLVQALDKIFKEIN